MKGQTSVRDNEIWELLILFFHLTERCCAVEFSKSDLLYLDGLLYSFFSNYTAKFPEIRLRLKANFIQHYPQMIFCLRLRFESKHSLFKSAVRLNKNNDQEAPILDVP